MISSHSTQHNFLIVLPYCTNGSLTYLVSIRIFYNRLVSGVALLLLNGLLKPVLLNRCCAGLARLALNLGHLALVGLKLAGNVGLLGRWGSLGEGELLNVTLGVGGLDGGCLVGLELLEVHVLDEVGCGYGVSFRRVEVFSFERRGEGTLDDGRDGEGAAHGGVLLAGNTNERLALRELAGRSRAQVFRWTAYRGPHERLGEHDERCGGGMDG
jgi:hypothetical protein